MLSPLVRRFTSSDLNDRAGWIVQRLAVKYGKSEHFIANYLRSLANRNDCLFLRTDYAVILVEMVCIDPMADEWVAQERFMLCEDRQAFHQLEGAAKMYENVRSWAKSAGIKKVVLDRGSDIPREQVRDYFWSKKIFPEEMLTVRV